MPPFGKEQAGRCITGSGEDGERRGVGVGRWKCEARRCTEKEWEGECEGSCKARPHKPS